MELTEELKKEIDAMSYESMLRKWRFDPDPIIIGLFQGESGDYFTKVMAEKRKTVDHVKVSKKLGWR